MAKVEQKWLPLFEAFIKELRISSKEVPAEDSRGAPLDLWGSQRLALEELCEGMEHGVRTFLFLKARQLGISTVFLAVDLFWLAIHPNTIGALVTENETNRSVFRETLQRYIESFPKGYLGKNFKLERSNKDFLLFSNGSRLDFIVAGTKSKSNWGEGRGYALAHLTEVAAYGSAEGLNSFRETLADQNPNRLFLYESTAKGFNHYKDMWEEFGRDKYTKKRTFIGWWAKEMNRIEKTDKRWAAYGKPDADPEEKELIEAVENQYGFKVKKEQLAWHRWRASDESSDHNTTNQNQPWTAEQAFVMTGYSFFQTRVLQKDLMKCAETKYRGYKYLIGNDFWAVQIEAINDIRRIGEVELRVWEEPEEGAVYCIGCDPAYGRGDNKNRHCISVVRCFADKIVQVAEYADNNVETRYCAWVLAHLAGIYRNCVINVEITGPGGVIITELEHLREMMRIDPRFSEKTQENEDWEDFLGNARWYIYHRPDHFGPGFVKCWETSWKTKSQIMNQLRDSYTMNIIETKSKPLIEEMLTVVQNKSEIGAPGNSTDDRVFALALANRAWIDSLRSGLMSQGATYGAYLALEDGGTGVDSNREIVNNIVQNFFKTAEERAQDHDPTPQWMRDRGFA